MTRLLYSALCLWLSSGAAAFSSFHPAARRLTAVQNIVSSSSTSLSMGLILYGHQGTRSPLVNWGAYELGLDLSMGDLAKNPHPFRQLPCLTDDEDVLVFESGAILQYFHGKTMDRLSKSQAAAVTSWIMWANASLDPICFLETPDGKVYDTGLKKPNKRLDKVNEILSSQKFLTGDDFTLADVAVASYLLYVLQFFPGTDISRWSNIVRYMKECAERPAYAQAFGENAQANLLGQLNTDASKKIFGMF